MIGLGLGLGLDARRGGARFSPAALFANGAAGYWAGGYDPAAGRLYQDSAGATLNSAAAQSVGLALSWTPGPALGPEIVTNGDGAAATGWAAARGAEVITATGGRIRVTAASTAAMGVSQALSGLVVGGFYRAMQKGFTGTVGAISNRIAHIGTLPSGSIVSTSLDINEIFIATETTMYVGCIAVPSAAGEYVEIDDISVRAVPGYNALQAVALSRPTLMQTAGGVWYLSDDGGDGLPATLPAATYTRAHVTSAGVVTIEDGIEISTAEDTLRAAAQADVLYIDRALSTAEAANLTAYWQRRYAA